MKKKNRTKAESNPPYIGAATYVVKDTPSDSFGPLDHSYPDGYSRQQIIAAP